MDTKSIAVANLKGGAGKTTTSFLLCLAAAAQGKIVAAFDLDPSGGLSRNLGLDPKIAQYTALDVLVKESVNIDRALIQSPMAVGNGIVYGLYYDKRLSDVGAINKTTLTRVIDQLKEQADYIIIDTQPEINALVPILSTVDTILIPSKVSVNDLAVSAQTVGEINRLNRLDALAGILFVGINKNPSNKVKEVINGFSQLQINLKDNRTNQDIIIPSGNNWIIRNVTDVNHFTPEENAIIQNLLYAVDTYRPPHLNLKAFTNRFIGKEKPKV